MRLGNAAIVGARGYSGLELARLLLVHPSFSLSACFAHDTAFRLSDYLPEPAAAKVPVFPLEELERRLDGLDFLFLATPAEASLELAPKILSRSRARVIDLSGAFRLQQGDRAARFSQWYRTKHSALPLLDEADYGLVPFAPPPAAGRRLVANPGCYATAVLMAIVPLLKAGLLQPDSIVIDAKSGTSGAGRKASEAQLFTEVDGECLPYRVGMHQHLPEICEWAGAYGGCEPDLFFTTSLLPVRRGIIAGIYARLAAGADAASVRGAFRSAYSAYPLCRLTELDGPAEGDFPAALSLSLKRVSGSARTQLSFKVIGRKLYLFSVIDNLLKGAASQAVENLNRLAGLPVDAGLSTLEGSL